MVGELLLAVVMELLIGYATEGGITGGMNGGGTSAGVTIERI
jgi:hypothetical protein